MEFLKSLKDNSERGVIQLTELSISKLGIESRSQRCTAAFLRHISNKGLIEYDSELIDRITVHKEKEMISDVDKREFARYGSAIKIPEVEQDYEKMMDLCKKAVSQCEEIVFSDKKFPVSEILSEVEIQSN